MDINPKNFPIRGESSRSNLQKEVGKKLLDKFALYPILEEWTIPGCGLSLDFFIPQLGIAIECQGRQHKEFNKFFHGDAEGFKKQQNRDKRKKEWCESNNIELIEIDKAEELENKL